MLLITIFITLICIRLFDAEADGAPMPLALAIGPWAYADV
jgi:hypothetical protein